MPFHYNPCSPCCTPASGVGACGFVDPAPTGVFHVISNSSGAFWGCYDANYQSAFIFWDGTGYYVDGTIPGCCAFQTGNVGSCPQDTILAGPIANTGVDNLEDYCCPVMCDPSFKGNWPLNALGSVFTPIANPGLPNIQIDLDPSPTGLLLFKTMPAGTCINMLFSSNWSQFYHFVGGIAVQPSGNGAPLNLPQTVGLNGYTVDIPYTITDKDNGENLNPNGVFTGVGTVTIVPKILLVSGCAPNSPGPYYAGIYDTFTFTKFTGLINNGTRIAQIQGCVPNNGVIPSPFCDGLTGDTYYTNPWPCNYNDNSQYYDYIDVSDAATIPVLGGFSFPIGTFNFTFQVPNLVPYCEACVSQMPNTLNADIYFKSTIGPFTMSGQFDDHFFITLTWDGIDAWRGSFIPIATYPRIYVCLQYTGWNTPAPAFFNGPGLFAQNPPPYFTNLSIAMNGSPIPDYKQGIDAFFAGPGSEYIFHDPNLIAAQWLINGNLSPTTCNPFYGIQQWGASSLFVNWGLSGFNDNGAFIIITVTG